MTSITLFLLSGLPQGSAVMLSSCRVFHVPVTSLCLDSGRHHGCYSSYGFKKLSDTQSLRSISFGDSFSQIIGMTVLSLVIGLLQGVRCDVVLMSCLPCPCHIPVSGRHHGCHISHGLRAARGMEKSWNFWKFDIFLNF